MVITLAEIQQKKQNINLDRSLLKRNRITFSDIIQLNGLIMIP